MPIVLTNSDRETLASYREQARAGVIGYWQIYEWLANRLVTEYGASSTDSTVLWLRGATEANAGRGSLSALIRSYSATQYQLRYGVQMPDGRMQEASDAVAENLLRDLLGEPQADDGWPVGQVPDIGRIADADATAVGRVLFNIQGDTAAPPSNSAWSGALLFSLLRSDQTNRLLGAGTAGTLDTLSDLRDVLFAFVSYATGLDAAREEGLRNLVLSQTDTPEQRAAAAQQIATDSFIAGPTIWSYVAGAGTMEELLSTVVQGAGQGPVAAIFSTIAKVGPNAYLDMLIGARQGRIQLGTTTDASFAQRARDFFSSFSAAELQSLSASLLPLSPGALASLAREDVNARAALAALSVVSVQIDEGAAGRLSLYDPATGEGALSDQWLVDRAMLLTAISARGQLQGVADHPALPTDRAYEFHYIDGTGAEQILIAENTARLGGNTRPVPRQQVYFGGSDNDSFTADPNNGRGARMFGGEGDDTLNGADKDDYLEGNDGNDVLNGGAGTDALLGGAGNDTLDGGTGNDWLYGGAGHDTYVFSGSFGADVIEDSDGDGVIQVEGIGSLPVGMELAEGVYASEDRRVFYTRVSARAGEEDLIVSFSDRPDTITIRNWSAERHLGITLQQPQAPTPPATTFEGDFVKEVIGDGTLRYRIVDGNFVRTGQSLPGGQDVYTGTSASERILGMGGDDALFGNGGEDWIDGGDGNDVLFGGSGRDRILGGAGDDLIYGAAEAYIEVLSAWQGDQDAYPPTLPVIHANGLNWHVHGRGQRDQDGFVISHLWGIARSAIAEDDGGNVIDAGAGDDFVAAGHGADVVWGGEGHDDLYGMGGADVLYGGEGDDRLYGDGPAAGPASATGMVTTPGARHGNDILDGGAGNDILIGQGGSDIIFGGDGDDRIWGDDRVLEDTPLEFHGNDTLYGGAGHDLIVGGLGDDRLEGGSGDDELQGDYSGREVNGALHGNDTLDGGDGNDRMWGHGGDDRLLGGDGNDFMRGDEDGASLAGQFHGNDYLEGGAGNDTMSGDGGDDELYGGDGDDEISGDAIDLDEAFHGNDRLYGGRGYDWLYGDGGDDYLDGGEDDDRLYGGEGHDVYVGGTGNDYLIDESATSNDIYRFARGDGYDYIVDHGGTDRIELGAGISESDVTLYTHGSNIVLYLDSGEQLTVAGVRDTGSGAMVAGRSIETISFANGVVWDQQRIRSELLKTTDGQDWVVGFDTDDWIDGGTGDDLLLGMHGNDTLIGGAGRDQLFGDSGDDVLLGGLGDDWLDGGEGNDWIDGGEGNDALYGGNGSDTYVGGAGNDSLYDYSALSSDVYRFGRGDGHDMIQDWGGTDRVVLEGNISQDDVMLRNDGQSLLIRLNSGESIAVLGMFQSMGSVNAGRAVEFIEFADGSVWDIARMRAETLRTTAGADTVYGTERDDTIDGGGGDDKLYGCDGNDTLIGGAGNDSLFGHSGDDIYIGGAGNETLHDYSSTSNDVYRFGRGDGQDSLLDCGGSADRIEWGSDIAADQLWFQRSGSSLVVSVIGTTDRITVNSWYSSDAYKIETLQLANGQTLASTQVQALVDAMASFAPPAAGQTTLPPNYQSSLGGVIASSWN